MCIRDSYNSQYSIFKAATERWLVCDAIKVMDTLYFSFSIFSSFLTVSYTHLDVYKRQLQSFLNASDILSTAVVEGSTKAYNQKLILADLVSV